MFRKQSDVNSGRISALKIDLLDIYFVKCYIFNVFASLNLLATEYFGTRRLSWFFPHDVKAASDDDSGSSAAHRQVWSVGRSAGRHSDRSGDPEGSTGTNTTSAGCEPVAMTHRRSTKLTTTTRVSVFKNGRAEVSPRSGKFSDVLA